jgi:hypothetical protein
MLPISLIPFLIELAISDRFGNPFPDGLSLPASILAQMIIDV